MVVLTARLLPAGLYSIRLPYTYQSALTYPLPPPSTIKGLLANAIQRAQNRDPIEVLEEIEQKVAFAAAAACGPIATRSCVVSSIVNFVGLPDKSTNALPRQFAHTRAVRIFVGTDEPAWAEAALQSLKAASVYLGDNESIAAVAELELVQVQPEEADSARITTRAYLPQKVLAENGGAGTLFWVHERCLKPKERRRRRGGSEWTLSPFIFPVRPDGSLYQPSAITGTLAREARLCRVHGEMLVWSSNQITHA